MGQVFNFDSKTKLDNTFSQEHTEEGFVNSKSGGGGGDMEIRIARLESDVEHIKNSIKEIKDDVREIKKDARTDFRLIFGALIAVALGLAGMMAKGFHWF
ncbi:hypothetical protein [Rouxiella sp. WC2420]|uniref:Hemolysin XhlA n=1 Tax=Rouxiella sp. WC2420 TaxID=3234145 RepID=A0AB39VLW4_9GAMM